MHCSGAKEHGIAERKKESGSKMEISQQDLCNRHTGTESVDVRGACQMWCICWQGCKD
jgi:hypothetical protein